MTHSLCPACHHSINVPFLRTTPQPLSTIAWPASIDEARNMPRLATDWRRCVGCGHVFNATFEYAQVPYNKKPNLMYNAGNSWKTAIGERLDELTQLLKPNDCVVEIGYGDGAFLAGLKTAMPSIRAVGFDPNGAKRNDITLELHASLFDPSKDLAAFKPRLLIARHVIEHILDPLGFLQAFSFYASVTDTQTMTYLETPCIDNALVNARTPDFYYEHSSQFSTESFTRMLQLCGGSEPNIFHSYRGEVIHALIHFGRDKSAVIKANESQKFLNDTDQSIARIRTQLDELLLSGKQVAIWGGTGKSASFMQRYNLDSTRFPVVVDSDPDKIGTFVPGTAQRIQLPNILKLNPIQVIIIPPQWRAADIVAEMMRENIVVEQVLIEHQGQLMDFYTATHPYR